MAAVFAASGDWVRAHQSRYWDVCLKSLATPALFAAGHRALAADPAFVERMLAYFQASLGGVAKYSAAAAEDIVQALQELVDGCATSPCPQLFSTSADRKFNVPAALLAAYEVAPRAAAGGKAAEGRLNWRILVVVTLNALLQQAIKQGIDSLSPAYLASCLALLVPQIVSPVRRARVRRPEQEELLERRPGGRAAALVDRRGHQRNGPAAP